ncbi:hypothetical protein LEMLEM_LOCUS15031 [Lemmus lemmus]
MGSNNFSRSRRRLLHFCRGLPLAELAEGTSWAGEAADSSARRLQ